jgi:hypothetical protein
MANVSITITCHVCEREQEPIVAEHHQFRAWTRGMKVQDAFPELTPGQRELMISGTCEPCFDKMFG